jgi:hypothetical protein
MPAVFAAMEFEGAGVGAGGSEGFWADAQPIAVSKRITAIFI